RDPAGRGPRRLPGGVARPGARGPAAAIQRWADRAQGPVAGGRADDPDRRGGGHQRPKPGYRRRAGRARVDRPGGRHLPGRPPDPVGAATGHATGRSASALTARRSEEPRSQRSSSAESRSGAAGASGRVPSTAGTGASVATRTTAGATSREPRAAASLGLLFMGNPPCPASIPGTIAPTVPDLRTTAAPRL